MTDRETLRSHTHVMSMREASPYIRSHRGKTFVVYVGGEAFSEDTFGGLAEDLILIHGLGIQLVVVHGARAQIDENVARAGFEQSFVGRLRVTDAQTLACVKATVSALRIEFEARLTQAALDVPSSAVAPTVSAGNFVVARPVGVVNGRDLLFTGEVRRLNDAAITRRLDNGEIVVVSPLGYSPTGEVFNLNALELATTVASELNAAKLIFMTEPHRIVGDDGEFIRELTVQQARERRAGDDAGRDLIECAIRACQFGVKRVHIVDHNRDGVLLEELFTRDGVGTLLSNSPFDHLKIASIDDVGGVLALIEPLETDGMLVKRSREKLEIEIGHFTVMVRDDMVIACGALYPYADAVGEIACIAVHEDYRGDGYGNAILESLERRASELNLTRVFVLTTQAPDWFREMGYARAALSDLPGERQALYNYQRGSLVLVKSL